MVNILIAISLIIDFIFIYDFISKKKKNNFKRYFIVRKFVCMSSSKVDIEEEVLAQYNFPSKLIIEKEDERIISIQEINFDDYLSYNF
jgi:hypothetical protein